MTFGGREFRRTIHKDLVKFCTEKIRRVKAQLEPNQATVITDKIFPASILGSKGGPWGIFILYCTERETMTRDEERTEVLSTLSQSLTVRQFFLRLSCPLS